MNISERIDRYIEDKEVIEQRAHELAEIYCEIMKKDFGYGVEKVEFTGSVVEITIDQTCRSCYSSETLYFNYDWMELDDEEFRATIQSIKDQEDEEARKIQVEQEKFKINRLKKELAELEARQK